MTATITLPSYAIAKVFARAWAFHSMRGHSISSSEPDGKTTVTLHDVSDADKAWIDSKVAEMNQPPCA